MPAKSKRQQHLMAAAAHGATFPKAREVRASLTPRQLGEFAATPTRDLPRRVPHGFASSCSPMQKL
jgi:hypothetical protein